MYLIKKVKKYTHAKTGEVKRNVSFFCGTQLGFPVFDSKDNAMSFDGPEQALDKIDEFGLSEDKSVRIHYFDAVSV